MLKLHVGCGKRNFGKEWIHIDGGDYPHLDSHDIVKLPYKDETVDLIYASHVLEYFDRPESICVVKEWHRVLKPGGILRLAVPDFDAIAHYYTRIYRNVDWLVGLLYGRMKMGDKYIYHKMVFDYDSLCSFLSTFPFKDMRIYNWRKTEHAQFDDHSQAYLPHMDKENGRLMSLNVEAVK
jgi:predicted SAM-dependent methyltransferase